ncbi:MAG TPA: hypothetical protein VG099_01305 [Gemmataceae bacterium]|nr:hypothetical protein [Gemmataceae bacterium]
MEIVLTALVLFAAVPPDRLAPAETYPQLIATSYPDRSQVPAKFSRPAKAFDFVEKAKLPAGAKVLSAARSANGAVWMVTDRGAYGTRGDGYVPLEIGPRRPEPGQPPVRAGTHVVAVASDRLGHVWAATNAGLYANDGTQWWQKLGRQDGVPYEVMTCLHMAPNGDVWGGTPEGAWRLRDGHFRYFWGRRWLPGNKVCAVWTDAQGRAWLDTDAGLACIEERSTTLAQKAAHFDRITQQRHNRRGFISQINLKVPGDPAQGYRTQISDNDGLWNAIYIGALAFRYDVTQDPAARKQARQSLHALLELERLTGIPGYPARAVVTDDELRAGIDGVNLEERVHVPNESDKIWFRSPLDSKVWCKGDTSSDEMDGHYFAWYVYHELVADAAEKQQISGVVRRATDHILNNGYTLVGHTQRKTRWGIWAPELINHDPFYVGLRPLNSLEILAYLKIAEHVTGDPKYARASNELIQKHHYLLNTLLIRRGRSGHWRGINHSDDEMLYLMYYALLRLDKDPDRRRILLESIARTWEGTAEEQSIRQEHSPLYNFIYGATTGRGCDVEESVQTLRDWPWDLTDWTAHNSHRHDVLVKPAPAARRGRLELDRVLPASERRLARWNGNPWAPDGDGAGRQEHDGAAWALAYWLGVYHRYLPKEKS